MIHKKESNNIELMFTTEATFFKAGATTTAPTVFATSTGELLSGIVKLDSDLVQFFGLLGQDIQSLATTDDGLEVLEHDVLHLSDLVFHVREFVGRRIVGPKVHLFSQKFGVGGMVQFGRIGLVFLGVSFAHGLQESHNFSQRKAFSCDGNPERFFGNKIHEAVALIVTKRS